MSNKYEDLVKGMTIKDFLNEKFDDMIDLIREGDPDPIPPITISVYEYDKEEILYMADPLIDIYKEYKGPNITIEIDLRNEADIMLDLIFIRDDENKKTLRDLEPEEGHNKLIQLCLNSAIES